MSLVTKTDQARALYLSGDRRSALRMAKDFRLGLSVEQRKLLSRGYECLVRPDFYKSLGYDPKRCVEEGYEVFEECWINHQPA